MKSSLIAEKNNLKLNMLQRKNEIRLSVNAAKAEKNIEIAYAEIKAFNVLSAIIMGNQQPSLE